MDRKASCLLPSITSVHTLTQSSAWIVRGLLAEWYGGRLVLKRGETLEWCPCRGVQIHLVTHYLCGQETWRLSSSVKPSRFLEKQTIIKEDFGFYLPGIF